MRKGFSLIEILIVVAIASALIFVVSTFSGNLNGLNVLVNQQLQNKSDINQTLQLMTTEIRSASPSALGAYPIDSAATSSFAFYDDIDKDGLVEHVRYFLSSSTIYKGVIKPTTSTPATYPTSTEIITDVVDNVIAASSTVLFTYYDASYNGTQPPMTFPLNIANIRVVGISFYSDVQPKQAPSAQFYSDFVDIRDLKTN